MSQSDRDRKTGLFRSAEAVAALSLLGVCLAVGAAYWWVSSKDSANADSTGGSAAGTAPDAQPRAAATEERAALDSWKRKLQGDFAQLDQQRQLDAQRQQIEQERQQAEAAKAEKVRSAAAAPPASPVQKPALTPPATLPPLVAMAAPALPVPEPVRIEATVDWSSCRRPEYPSWAKERGEEGTVVLSVQVDAAGRVQSGGIATSSGSHQLDQAALETVQQCRFKPATVDGTAVASLAMINVRWRLHDTH